MINKQKQLLINYFKNEEKAQKDFLLGMEIEHLVVDRDNLQATSFFAPGGIEDLLVKLAETEKGWSRVYEQEHLVGLNRDSMSITLEPGGQLEISLAPRHTMSEVDELYCSFLDQFSPLLERENKVLLNLGYQPVSRIEEIPLLPKKRYRHMYDYFKTKGQYAHNMMKGTASVHVSLDYKSETDFARKCRVASFLAPIIYIMFDNSPFFEGEIYPDPGLRATIWANCDRERCGPLPGVFEGEYGYSRYADYMLDIPPILWKDNEKLKYTGSTPLKDIMIPEQMNRQQIEHILTMVFPEIRIKNCLEIRVADSLPYPYNMGYLSFWQGIMYNPDLLQRIDREIKKYSVQEIIQLRKQIMSIGLQARINNKNIFDYFEILMSRARKNLPADSRTYLDQLIRLFSSRQNMRQQILTDLSRGKKRALQWCMVKEVD